MIDNAARLPKALETVLMPNSGGHTWRDRATGETQPMLCLMCGHIGNLIRCPRHTAAWSASLDRYYDQLESYPHRVLARPHELAAYRLGGPAAVRDLLDG